MSAQPEHPSYLELDALLLGSADAAARKHVAACEPCQRHVERLRGLAEAPLPPLLRARMKQAAPAPSRRLWLLAPMFAAAAAAVALLVLPSLRAEVESGVTRIKGGPAVAVHILRGQEVVRWDGRAAVQSGDRLRLELAAPGYSQVTVATPQGEGLLHVLYSGPLAADSPALLPTSWQVDGSGESETLVVVFSHRPLGSSELRRAELHRSDLTVRELVLPKAKKSDAP